MGIGFSLLALAGAWMLTFDLNVTMTILVGEQPDAGLRGRHHLGAAVGRRLRHAAAADRAEASSVFHLLRNIGSSFFISLCDRRNRAHHRRELQPHDRDDLALQHALTLPGSTGGWDFDTVPGLARLAKEIDRQAAMIGYLNAFTMYTVTSAAAVAVVLLVRRKKAGA